MLTISSENRSGSLVVTLEGRLDATAAKQLEERCLEWIDAGARRLILDFTGVDFISSAGLRAILLVAKQLAPVQGQITLCGLSTALSDVFAISGFSKLFRIVPSVAEAL